MENTKLPIEIYTTDELCTEIIRRIKEEKDDFTITQTAYLLYDVLFTEISQRKELSMDGGRKEFHALLKCDKN